MYHDDGGGIRYVGPAKKGREKGEEYVPNTFHWIRAPRLARKWSQERLAEELAVSRSVVNKIESGRAKLVKASVAVKLIELFGEPKLAAFSQKQLLTFVEAFFVTVNRRMIRHRLVVTNLLEDFALTEQDPEVQEVVRMIQQLRSPRRSENKSEGKEP